MSERLQTRAEVIKLARLPSRLVATIAQRAFGPLLCARAAGSVDTAKALDVAKRLPPEFLADVTVELDPRRVAAIIADVPRELVVPVARELGERAEYVTMGRFLAYVPDHAIVAAMGVLSDEARSTRRSCSNTKTGSITRWGCCRPTGCPESCAARPRMTSGRRRST